MSLKRQVRRAVAVKEGMLSSDTVVAHFGFLSIAWLMDPALLP